MDDVVDASPVHMFCGVWGLIAAGLFSTKLGYAAAYSEELADECAGLFYGGGGRTLGANFLFALAVMAWVGLLTAVLFVTVKLTVGIRVSTEQETMGLDDSKHGGQTYPELRGMSGVDRSSFNEGSYIGGGGSFIETGSCGGGGGGSRGGRGASNGSIGANGSVSGTSFG